MDLSLQLQVQDSDLEEFPETSENSPLGPEDSYPTFRVRRKKNKKKNPRNKNKKPPPIPLRYKKPNHRLSQ